MTLQEKDLNNVGDEFKYPIWNKIYIQVREQAWTQAWTQAWSQQASIQVYNQQVWSLVCNQVKFKTNKL